MCVCVCVILTFAHEKSLLACVHVYTYIHDKKTLNHLRLQSIFNPLHTQEQAVLLWR